MPYPFTQFVRSIMRGVNVAHCVLQPPKNAVRRFGTNLVRLNHRDKLTARLAGREVLPEAKVLVTYSGDANDPAKGKEAAQAQISQDVSVIYPYLGGATDAVAALANKSNIDTLTPGTSTGYCMARNSPARARSSTVIDSTSTPSSVTVPPVISYLGCPASE